MPDDAWGCPACTLSKGRRYMLNSAPYKNDTDNDDKDGFSSVDEDVDG